MILYDGDDLSPKNLLAKAAENLVLTLTDLSVWFDKEIAAGSRYLAERLHRLSQADIIVLLVSPDFLAADHLWKTDIEVGMAHGSSPKRVGRG